MSQCKKIILSILLCIIIVCAAGCGEDREARSGAEGAASAFDTGVEDISDSVSDVDGVAGDTDEAVTTDEGKKTVTSGDTDEAVTTEEEKETGVSGINEEPVADEYEKETGTTEDIYMKQAEEIVSDMTLREKICQMLFVSPESITGVSAVTMSGDIMQAALVEYPVGGIMYSEKNFVSKSQTADMIADAQAYSRIDLFVSTDEEGGVVSRLMGTVGTTYVKSMYTYKDEGLQTAYDNAKTIAADMYELGFNLDFAPVADVWSNQSNTVIGKRAYSDDFESAAALISYAVKGFHDGNIMCTLKHFPGHGDTVEDSHYGNAYVNKGREQIECEELLPFISGIEADADFVMVGHITVSDIEDVPASFSKEIVTGMLRDELGFDGIIITDSLLMEAVADCYTVEDMAVLAIKAGNDMLLLPQDVDRTIEAITAAVENGEITEERIDESVTRILAAKLEYGLCVE